MTNQLSTDHRNLIVGSGVVPGLCLMSAIWPETEDFVGYGLIGGTVLAIGAAALRRELRIRRRLAEIHPLSGNQVRQVAEPVGEHETRDAATSGVSMTKVA